jgi:hypothetical protein
LVAAVFVKLSHNIQAGDCRLPGTADLRTRLLYGFNLIRSQTIPDIDNPCGQHFSYRQLLECGETQARTRLANRPVQPDSYTALHELAVSILDPVIDYYFPRPVCTLAHRIIHGTFYYRTVNHQWRH